MIFERSERSLASSSKSFAWVLLVSNFEFETSADPTRESILGPQSEASNVRCAPSRSMDEKPRQKIREKLELLSEFLEVSGQVLTCQRCGLPSVFLQCKTASPL